MNYVMTLVWGFILSHVLTYVICSMVGASYSFSTASIISIPVFILLSIIGSISKVDVKTN